MKEWARQFYKSQAWKLKRDYIMKRDHYLCRDCMKIGQYNPAEEVHHIKPLTPNNINDLDISLGDENLISLCRECHRKRHTRTERRYTVDEFGRVK